VTLAFVLPLVVRAGESLFRGSRGRRILLAAITIALLVGQTRKLDHQAALARPGKRSDRGAVLATAALVRDGQMFLLARPLNAFEPQVTVDKIVAMDRDGKLPPLREATARDFLTVLARLDLVVGPRAVVPPARVAHLVSTRRATVAPGSQGCLQVRAHPGNEVVLRLDGPGTFGIRGEGLLGARLRDPRHGVEGEIVYSVLARGQDAVMSAATADDLLVLTLPTAGPTDLCDLVG